MVDHAADGAKAQSADGRLIYAVVIGSGVYSIAYIVFNLHRHHDDLIGLFGDFFAFWTFAKFAISGNAGQIYDLAQLTDFQRGLGLQGASYPYPYPPVFLLLIWPFGLLPYLWGSLLWIVTTFAAYVAAAMGGNWRSRVLVLLFAPATLVTIIFGQNGFLTAALLVGGMRLVSARPVIAGVLLGLLSYKPTLAAIIPPALIAAGLWTTLTAACATILVLVGASIFLFGASLWHQWFAFLPQFQELFDQQRSILGHLMPTPYANLLGFGVDPIVAQVGQAAVSASVVAAICFMFHHGRGTLPISALSVGALLVTPYAFIYDMPTTTIALIFLIEDGYGRGYSYLAGERVIFLATWLLPLFLAPGLPFPIPGSLILLALLACILLHNQGGRAARAGG